MASPKVRGIQTVEYTNADGQAVEKYRVRVVRKDFKADRYFDDFDEAKEFLALSKVKKGKEIIFKITEEERVKKLAEQTHESRTTDYSFGHFCQLYIEQYVLTRPDDTELQRRNRANILSFLKTIQNTSIPNRYLSPSEKQEMGLEADAVVKVFMKGFDVRQIKAIEMNHYIKARLKKGKKPISVGRELSHIANVFNKLKYFNESLCDLDNPVYKHDRDLLKNRTVKREVYVSDEDEKKLLDGLRAKANQELYKVAKLSLLTAMRRSEILTLNLSQIGENHIQLHHTKSGRPRKVYLTVAARDFVKTLKPVDKSGKLFNYTIAGFDRVFRQFTHDNGLAHVHFHDLRRKNISNLIMKLGAENSVFITEFIGMQSVPKLEELHAASVEHAPTNQPSALKNFGHSWAQTTKGYVNINLDHLLRIATKKPA
ncbi:phage integrase family protein [Burkholderia lata]|uniref:Phage integrase family protein n=1 Tax=Burkholderia lata (strain ATCC 17760 / DSM 23089 / LMG 22485 / NCIMB 9086 / R18194 / 383) TaxID=482957 RepID=A0A6P2TNX1_BURL3|nr:site-specific integrase [Burkholderia lata]VWC65584.1 phage integrase family protein [Burkholderia lata]